MVYPIAHIHIKPPRLTKERFVDGGAAAVDVAGGLVLGLALGLCSHHPQFIKQTHLLAAYERLIGGKTTVKALLRGATETTTRPTYI